MNEIDSLQIRRRILDWRDEHVAHIEHHLGREIYLLFKEIDEKIDKMSVKELLQSQEFAKNNLEPICEQWLENETRLLFHKANQSLQIIYQTSLTSQQVNVKLETNNHELVSVTDVASVIVAGVSFAAIPSLIGISLTTGRARWRIENETFNTLKNQG